jgi:molybdate transport system substrate-binding protein
MARFASSQTCAIHEIFPPPAVRRKPREHPIQLHLSRKPTMQKTLFTTIACSALVVCLSASAAEIKVLTAGAFKPVVTALVPEFEKQTGHKVTVENDTAGALTKRVEGGEAFDLLVLTPSALAALTKSGKVAEGSTKLLARVAIGVAVKKGAIAPDISTVAAFQSALLAARAVAYIDPAAGGSSGIYLSQLFEKMGIADRIKPKAVLVPGGLVAQRLLNDQADIAIHQISEILAVPGATLVGPIPAEIQNYTVYAAGISATARDSAAARALLDTLSGTAARELLKAKGMEAP